MAADGVLPPVRPFLVGIAGPAVHMPAARRHVRALMGAYLGVTQFQLAQLLLGFGTQAQAVRQIRQTRRAALLSVVLTRPACRGKGTPLPAASPPAHAVRTGGGSQRRQRSHRTGTDAFQSFGHIHLILNDEEQSQARAGIPKNAVTLFLSADSIRTLEVVSHF